MVNHSSIHLIPLDAIEQALLLCVLLVFAVSISTYVIATCVVFVLSHVPIALLITVVLVIRQLLEHKR